MPVPVNPRRAITVDDSGAVVRYPTPIRRPTTSGAARQQGSMSGSASTGNLGTRGNSISLSEAVRAVQYPESNSPETRAYYLMGLQERETLNAVRSAAGDNVFLFASGASGEDEQQDPQPTATPIPWAGNLEYTPGFRDNLPTVGSPIGGSQGYLGGSQAFQLEDIMAYPGSFVASPFRTGTYRWAGENGYGGLITDPCILQCSPNFSLACIARCRNNGASPGFQVQAEANVYLNSAVLIQTRSMSQETIVESSISAGTLVTINGITYIATHSHFDESSLGGESDIRVMQNYDTIVISGARGTLEIQSSDLLGLYTPQLSHDGVLYFRLPDNSNGYATEPVGVPVPVGRGNSDLPYDFTYAVWTPGFPDALILSEWSDLEIGLALLSQTGLSDHFDLYSLSGYNIGAEIPPGGGDSGSGLFHQGGLVGVLYGACGGSYDSYCIEYYMLQ